ncbi:MAG: hypothetical protein H6704_16875 [Myxococcales bacterium]|nr:hypothetical protein [Myxococcales bacterium]
MARARKKAKETGGKGRITAEARRRGAAAKAARGVFNRYIKALQGKAVTRTQARIDEIDATLARGTRLKKSPVFEDGKRVGTTERQLPLLPSERAILMAQRRRLEESLTQRAPDELRAQFLAMLPEYAERHELTRDILLEVGVPAEDLDAVGIVE